MQLWTGTYSGTETTAAVGAAVALVRVALAVVALVWVALAA